jgi:hypothetical protein
LFSKNAGGVVKIYNAGGVVKIYNAGVVTQDSKIGP